MVVLLPLVTYTYVGWVRVNPNSRVGWVGYGFASWVSQSTWHPKGDLCKVPAIHCRQVLLSLYLYSKMLIMYSSVHPPLSLCRCRQ